MTLSDYSDGSRGGLSNSENEANTAPKARRKKLVFRDEHNFPIAFVLHKSLSRHEKRALTKDIENHGGTILEGVEGERGADTILISRNGGAGLRSSLQLAYHGIGDPSRSKIHVEFAQFIRRCILNKEFVHSVPQVQGMGGVPSGHYRNEFTEGDDEMLCWFLSRVMPDKAAGGRLGLAVYKNLLNCANVLPEEYGWAKRHTVESWKQRYKKNQAEFDIRIGEMVQNDAPRKEQKWPQDRRMTNAAIDKRKLQYESSGEEDRREEEEESEAEKIVKVSNEKRGLPENRSPPKSTNKRQRVAQRPERKERRQQTSTGSKGKQKAIEIEDDEQVDQQQSEPNSLFDGDIMHFDFDEPPPPVDPRSPDRTLVASSRSNNPQNISTTQSTLAETSTRNDPPMSVSRARDQPGPGNWATQPRSQPVWLSPPAQSSPHHPLQSSHHRAPAPPPSQPSPPPPAQQPSPRPSQVPRKAARRRPPPEAPVPEAPVVAEASAPYRNTRQRSRSAELQRQVVRKPKIQKQATSIPEEPDGEVDVVQPQRPIRASARLRSIEPDDPPIPAPKKNVRKKKAEPIPEEREEDERANVQNQVPIGETLAEEMDVVNLLTRDAPERSILAALSRRGASMDTDDAHIDRHLRPGSVSSQIRPLAGFNFLKRPPSDILKRFEASSSRRHSMLPTSSNRPTPAHPRVSEVSPRKSRQSEPVRRQDADNPQFREPNPRTPVRRNHDRDSSVESFPPSGTRARALMDVLTQREKTTPYRPPPGTRAAKFADAL